MPKNSTITNSNEREQTLSDVYTETLMTLVVAAAGLRQLKDWQAFGKDPGLGRLPRVIRNAKKQLDVATEQLIAFTIAHPSFYEQTADALTRMSVKEPMLTGAEKRLRKAHRKR